MLTDWQGETYNSILVIVDQRTKIVQYKPVKITIDALSLSGVIIDVVVRHQGLPDTIVSDYGSVLTSKLLVLFCYFFGIKRRLSTAFYPKTDSQTKRQNSTVEAYLKAFVNFEQNNWARLLPMAEFAYNNAKNASTSHMSFELNCGCHPRVSLEEDIDRLPKSKSADEPAKRLKDLMTVCQKNLHHT